MAAELGKYAQNPEALAVTGDKQTAQCSKAGEAKRIQKVTKEAPPASLENREQLCAWTHAMMSRPLYNRDNANIIPSSFIYFQRATEETKKLPGSSPVVEIEIS